MRNKSLFILAATLAFGSITHGQAPAATGLPGQPAAGPILRAQAPELPRFDLEIPSRIPLEEAVHEIRAQAGTLNIIIPEGYADIPMPPLKLKNVTVPELFTALSQASQAVSTKGGQYIFETADRPPREDSVWSVRFFGPLPTEPICRFYQLGPYLDRYNVDDITTAVHTAWKMLGNQDLPELKFHDDTKLLIAVGHPRKLELIDQVLSELGRVLEPREPSGAPVTVERKAPSSSATKTTK